MEMQKIEDLWFDDGNIAIVIGNQACRVHKGVLASLSPLLAEDLSAFQPAGQFGQFDRLPCFSFPDDDKADELLHFLRAMLLPNYFEVYPQRIHKDKLLAVLRLSHKYEVAHLRQRCLLHLGHKFGTSIATHQRWPWYFDEYDRQMTIVTDGMFDRDFLCALIPIAREVGALWILPALFYDLHFVASTEKAWLNSPNVPLTQEDASRLRRIEMICENTFSLLKIATESANAACSKTPKCCIEQAGKFREIFWGMREPLIARPLSFMKIEAVWRRPDSGPGPLDDSTAHSLGSELALHTSLCGACQKAVLVNFYGGGCRSIWAALPGVLGIGSWDQLRRAKAQDTGEKNGVYLRAMSEAPPA